MEQKKKSKKPVSEKKKQLNELGEEWVNISETEDKAAWDAKWYEIWQMLFDIYYPHLQKEAEFSAFEKAIYETREKYIAYNKKTKADDDYRDKYFQDISLSAYFSTALSRRIIDETKKETRQNPIERIGLIFEDENGDSSQIEVEGKDNRLPDIIDEMAAACAFFEIASAINNFSVNHNKKSGNDVRRNYYSLFFTSGITSYIKMSNHEPYFQHRRDISKAMKGKFVNYCMEDECRKLADIFRSELKIYDMVVDDPGKNSGKLIPLPIPDIVGITYLERVENKTASKSTYSGQKKAYKTEMGKILYDQDLIEKIYYNEE